MRPFRFRAAVVLDLRRKEEDAARQRRAQAQAAFEQAEVRVVGAGEAVAGAGANLQRAAREGVEAWRLGWHQSWIHRQRLDRDACRRAAAASEVAVDRATVAAGAARQRLRALERLRDRARRRHQLETVRHEGRNMNLAAMLRFAAAAANEGAHSDDRPDDDGTGGGGGG